MMGRPIRVDFSATRESPSFGGEGQGGRGGL